MILRRHSRWLPPSPTRVLARARHLLRPSVFTSEGPGILRARSAEVWTPLEPSGYVRVGRRLLPVRWDGSGVAPAVGAKVGVGRPRGH